MSEELFEVPEVKSPRLKWIEKHRIKIRQTPNWTSGMEDFDGDEVHKFYACDDGNWRFHAYGGETEDAALAEWARCRGKRLWFEEGL